MDGEQQDARLREIEAWMESSRRDLDEALGSAGLDPESFRRLATDPPKFTAEQQRVFDEIVEPPGTDRWVAAPAGPIGRRT